MKRQGISVPVVRWDSPQGRRLFTGITAARARRNEEVHRAVDRIISDVRREGDRALFRYTKKFDGCTITARTLRVGSAHIAAQARKVDAALRLTLREAAQRIRAYHMRQKRTGYAMRTAEGRLEQKVLPLRRVGVYIPGGHAIYPSTVLMNVIPAQVAGVRDIAAVTPLRGDLDPVIACAAQMLGITELYRAGGAQAIAALAYGTRSIPPVDKIVGPGNAYVAAAKKQVYGDVDIDTVAGPSEVVILADESADPVWVALDLLSQAEHGSGDETAVCVTESMAAARRIGRAVEREIAASPVREVLARLPSYAVSVFVTGVGYAGL